jgi:hypothetical protein
MNPVHILAISLLALLAWGLGFITGQDKDGEVWPNGPSLLFVMGALIAALVSLCLATFLSLQ